MQQPEEILRSKNPVTPATEGRPFPTDPLAFLSMMNAVSDEAAEFDEPIYFDGEDVGTILE